MLRKIVVCMKWGQVFSPDYVNNLYAATKRNITDLAAFVCFTDAPEGLHASIDARPMPEIPIDQSFYRAGAWPKLGLFKKDVLPDSYRALFIDLDMIICGDLDKFFELPYPFYAIGGTSWNAPPKPPKSFLYRFWKGWRSSKKAEKRELKVKNAGLEGRHVKKNAMGSGIFAFDSNTLSYIYDAFIRDTHGARLLYDNEQHFLEAHLKSWHPWPPGWVIHYKYSLRQPLVKDLFIAPKEPPPGTSVVAFSGRPRPHELAERTFSSLKEFPHCRIGRVDWAQNYWNNPTSS